MTVFWFVAALLLLGALLMLLPPLLRARTVSAGASGVNVAVHRDHLREAEADLAADLIAPDRLEQVRAEIHRRVLEDTATDEAAAVARPSPRVAVAVGLAVVLGSVAGYLWLGEPKAIATAAPSAATDRHALTPEQIQQMVGTLAERLKGDPSNADGWLMLGRSYTALGRYADAAIAMRRASDLRPADAGLLADLADVAGMAQGKRLAGEPARLVQRALDIDPRHVKALALAGSVAFEAGDWPAARGYWERLLAVIPPDSTMARSIRGSVAQATQRETGAPPAATSAPAPLRGVVTVGPEVAARMAPGDTLFVFARAAQGPRMPLAIVRQPAAAMPFAFALDDTMAMAPNLRLSGFDRVVVGARLSRSGDATPQSGDLVGESAPVAATAQGVKIAIDRVQP